MTDAMPDPALLPWRTGQAVGSTIWAQLTSGDTDTDLAVGSMDTPALAAEACRAHNLVLAGDAAGLAVLEVAWSEGSVPRNITFGPWPVTGSESHYKAVNDFLNGWIEATGIKPERVIMSVLTSPAAWQQAHPGPAPATEGTH